MRQSDEKVIEKVMLCYPSVHSHMTEKAIEIQIREQSLKRQKSFQDQNSNLMNLVNEIFEHENTSSNTNKKK
jgi:hypothetical protein